MTTLLDDPSEAAPVGRLPLPSADRLFRQTFAWSVHREFWEHRSLYVAPIAVASLVLFGFLIGALTHGSHMRLDVPADARALAQPYDFAAASVLLTTLVIAFVYCLGALYNERRDRTILFWKSLPVSDLTAVLAKASIPLVALPVIAFVVIFLLQMIMLAIGSATMLASGQPVAPLWSKVASAPGWIFLAYSLLVLSLWYAPIYGWLLLVSGWSKKAPFLWAILVPLALSLVEKFALNTSHVFELITDRFGGFTRAFAHDAPDGDVFQRMDPVAFFSSPGLWMGLMAAAALLAAAVWVRRRREAI